MESTEAFRVVEQGVQKPVADSSASAYIPSKPPVSTPPLWDGKKRGDPLVEPVAFPQGLPAGAEEQRQFLTEQCIASFCLCLSRFPQHYKSLYRLAFLYTYSKTHRVRRALERNVGYDDGRLSQDSWNFGVQAWVTHLGGWEEELQNQSRSKIWTSAPWNRGLLAVTLPWAHPMGTAARSLFEDPASQILDADSQVPRLFWKAIAGP